MNNYKYHQCFHSPNREASICFSLPTGCQVHAFQKAWAFLLDLHSMVKSEFYSADSSLFMLWYMCISILLGAPDKRVMASPSQKRIMESSQNTNS